MCFSSSSSMAEKEEQPPVSPPSSSSSSPIKFSASRRPSITLPPRSTMETMFAAGMGFSPGPMTLVSSFFSETDPDSECRSFSQLLAGAMAPPVSVSAAAAAAQRVNFPLAEESSEDRMSGDGGGGEDSSFRFQQNRPTGLVIGQSPMFTVPPGLSPACLLDSPELFSSGQGSFGMSHQQALAQVTAQAAQTHSQMHLQAEYPSSVSAQPAPSLTQIPSLTAHTTTRQQMPRLVSDSKSVMKESSEVAHSDQRSQSSIVTADKPADDGYNWRKYGQKQVKGSEFPRSYYKCTHPSCPVTKKVERSLDGHVTEIIYKGQHNHQPPQPNKRGKGMGHQNGNTISQGHPEFALQSQTGISNQMKGVIAYSSKKEQESSQATPEHISGSSDSEEVGDVETRRDEREEDERDPKRRNTEVRVSEPASSHKTVTEPRIIVQTTSEVDLLDDGYRWRKYGQKVVKGNPYPRSYYKCTTPACNVRKHVERAASDPKAVITTYEGKHNHDVPAARNSSHNTANSNALQLRPNGAVAEKHTNLGNSDQQHIAVLRLKEEQIT